MTKDAKRQKKKVLYVITKSNFGGAQRYVYDLATNLPRAQYDVSVAAGGSGELIARLNEHHIPVITIERLGRDIRLLNEIVVFLKLVALFRRTRPDVVHLNSSKIGGLGALAARIYNMLPKGNPLKAESYKLKAKIIFTAHGWAFNEPRSHSS
ncbi:glycosyltransferase family 4 protein, partial [candidate division KSB1 bacterium]|nr:glycosyltransferase family 4 protein [candidate division KSB1 bacterium]NIW72203.1 glycosyltransferase [candidate division KSB1 bacterium]NIX73619.1 glycosyltransferase [candidate division KSB1 bacterium]